MKEKLDRYECLKYLASKLTDELVVSCFSFNEWPFVSNERPGNIQFSQLGCTLPLGIGLSMALSHRKVIVLVSDGDLLMELGALPTMANENPKNLVVFVNDNETYQTIGGYPTMTAKKTDLAAMAVGAGVSYAVTVRNFEDFKSQVDLALSRTDCARFIVLKTDYTPLKMIWETVEYFENKYRFIRYIEKTERTKIFPSPVQDQRLVEK